MPATRPPPPSGRPPAYAIASRAFGRTNLRPVVISCTIIGTIWSLVWAGGAFQDINGEKQDDNLKKLVTFDIVLGSLYAGVAAIELFGLSAAVMRRASLVRIFVFLSVGVAAIVAAAELTRTVAHFTFKSAIINECIQVSTNPDVVFGFDFWGNVVRGLTSSEANEFCNRSFSRSTVSTIAWLIFATLFALFFASIAYSFYRQLLDPMFLRQARAPSEQVRLESMGLNNQNQYGFVPYDQQQPYGYPGAPQQGYGGGYNPYPSFAPPPGPPPQQQVYAPPYESTKLPGYGADGGAVKDLQDDKEDPFKDSDRPTQAPGQSRNEPDDPFKDGGRNVL